MKVIRSILLLLILYLTACKVKVHCYVTFYVALLYIVSPQILHYKVTSNITC